MRQKILLLIILIGNLACFAQDLPRYGELLCDKMFWGYMGPWTPIDFDIVGSKVMNGKTYGLLQMNGERWSARSYEPDSNYRGFSATIGIRDEGGRIYVDKEEYLDLMTDKYFWSHIGRSDSLPYETTPDGELVLYDFNKNAGEVYCKMPDGSELTVSKVDTLKTEDGVSRRRLTLSNGLDLIEGVGCTNSEGFLLFWLNAKHAYTYYSTDYFLLLTFGIKGDNAHYILARDYDTTIKEKNGRYYKMLTQGRRWVYDYDNGDIKGTLTYTIDGDTLLHAYRRSKLYMTLVDNQTNKVIRSGYAGAFREFHGSFDFYEIPDGCLGYLAPDTSKEKKLYKFAWGYGSYDENDGISRFCVNDDNITVGEESLHRLQLVNRQRNKDLPRDKDSLYYWVDGIGSSKGLLEYSAGPLMDSIRFVACYDGDKCIFTRDDFYKDSGQPSKFVGNLWYDSLAYEVRFGEKSAKLIRSGNYQSFKHVVIPSSVELWGEDCAVNQIDKEVFKDMPALTSIEMPESVTTIGESAFEGCTGLTSIDIPESVTSIGGSAFGNCTGLTSIDIPKSVTTIGKSIFDGCTGLTSIVIPESITVISENAFKSCTGLTSIEVPEGVTSLEYLAFGYCSNLKSITLPSTLVYMGNNVFFNCNNLPSITLPEGVDSIRYGTFSKCNSLKEVYLPASLTSIARHTFRWCTSLEHVYCLATKVPDATQSRVFFESSYQQATLHVPSASVNLYKKTEPWNGFKFIVPIEEETDAIMVQKSAPDTHLLFDLLGRPVKDASRHGIYVKDGRKVIR